MKIDPPQNFNNGARLYIIEPTAEIQNHTAVKCIEQNQTHWRIILISALLNGFLIIVITGLLRSFIYGSKRTRNSVKQFQELEVMNLEQPQVSTQVQYVAVEFPHHVKVFSPAAIHFYSC
ncbi:hypothetical protein G5714_021939 [Onychostoma macrolepis]|uniref:Uncharacterized protein n=1 Tax=Onychostoma macrolepis TaxID=369639 RepID=A0A7J6BT52_9TELE|nr:hypothetical protein G5714_021939 [Onychostoma macrolepis]